MQCILSNVDVRNKRSYECGDKLFQMIMANFDVSEQAGIWMI
jgi:hypothetical protein